MWLETCLCSLGISLSLFLQMVCPGCMEFVKILPLTTAYAFLFYLFLPTQAFKSGAFLVCAGIQGGTLHASIGMLLGGAGCAVIGREIWQTPFIHGRAKITPCIALAFFFLYLFFKVLGVDRDLLYVPILFSFLFSLWMWILWESRGHTTFKLFVLGAIVAHTFEMGGYLVPHPPLSPVYIHLLPCLFFLSPLVYLGGSVFSKRSRFGFPHGSKRWTIFFRREDWRTNRGV